jgi:undecaprenyl diphosphate synthase
MNSIKNDLHVAIIMDGNGRWAKKHKRACLWGYQKGARTLRNIIRLCPKYYIKYLTVYAFSTENWQRDPEEINGLMNLFKTYFSRESSKIAKEGVRLKIIGDPTRLSLSLQKLIKKAEELTKDNELLELQIALNYGGKDEIVHAIRKLSAFVKQGVLNPEDITADHVTQSLWTYPLPDPDLLIRTGGELRLSNYLLWQMSYTELFFTPKYWPEFTEQDLQEALSTYNQRGRRFGG